MRAASAAVIAARAQPSERQRCCARRAALAALPQGAHVAGARLRSGTAVSLTPRGRVAGVHVHASSSPYQEAEHARLKNIPDLDRVAILAEALPYLQKFHGKTVVIKYGGAAMTDPALKEGVIRDLVLLSTVGIRPILVHGGGPEINGWLKRLNIEPQFRNGLRVTDAATMEVVEMVLVGKVNKSLVSLINMAGGSAVGMCGKDGNLLSARVLDPELGLVGEVTDVDTRVINGLVAAGHIPVVATVAADADGGALNVNADTAAGEIAASLGAEKLVLMTDVRGLLRDKSDASTLIRDVTISGVRRLVADGIVAGGMIPKVECCVRALAQGVRATHIIDGRQPHSLLLEILTDAGGGTMIAG